MSFELTILGSSSALPTSNRFPAAHLLKVNERFFLIDCGEGTQIQLRRFGFNPARIHHVFISHLHGDHVFGLFGLISSMGLTGRKVTLHIYGPEMLQEMLEKHFYYFARPPFPLKIHVCEGTEIVFENKQLEVRSIPLKHRTSTFGYVFREKIRELNVRKEKIREHGLGVADIVKIKRGEDQIAADGKVIPNAELTLPPYKRRSYAYISDTVYDPAIAEQIMGVDLLFHEATFSHKDEKLAAETLHSTSVQAAEVARTAGAEKLIIGHFSTRYKDAGHLVEEAQAVFPETYMAEDGASYSLPLQREIR